MEQEIRQRRRPAGEPDTSTTATWNDDRKKAGNRTRRSIWKEIILSNSIVAIALCIIAFAVRLQSIENPSQVVFDEVHFGTFANKYIQHRFFFDVHPPLAKLLIAFMGQIMGYDGQFDFGMIGNEYQGHNVPYVQMRCLSACFGAVLAPLAYLTLRTQGLSMLASGVAAVVICYENSLVANSRLILLDSFLLFFIALTVLSWFKFFNQRTRPFGKQWWLWLMLTGVGLGLTVSCKWVGLFTIATIGLSTIRDLWRLWGDLSVPAKSFLSHCFARILCLICIPAAIYIGMFYVHFRMLPFSGDGNVHMSAAFQHSLVGPKIPDSPLDVAYGSRITLRHLATKGGYLHSHPSTYPEGSKQQQVTLYPYRDQNNWWIIRKMNSTLDEANDEGDILGVDNKTWIQWVRHGDIIRLDHVATMPRRLHSHDEKPPVTDLEYHKEVSGYGFPDYEGDANDYWRVEIEENDRYPEAGKRLQTLRSRIRLVHVLQSCALFSHEVKLPSWGFGQQEVTCIQGGTKPKTIWMIEESQHDLLPLDTPQVNYEKLGFWSKFAELHKAMWKANEGLTEPHPYESRPISWPTLQRGISLWASQDKHIYFLGNPIVYWAATEAVLTFIIVWGFFQLRGKRGYPDLFRGMEPKANSDRYLYIYRDGNNHLEKRVFYEESAGFFVVSWAMHYLPFFIMRRQLFLHHYLPALYFSILVLAVGVDLILKRARSGARLMIAFAITTVIIVTFRHFAPITYGTEWTREVCLSSQWLNKWDFGCSRYPSAYTTSEPLPFDITQGPNLDALKSLWEADQEAKPLQADPSAGISVTQNSFANRGPWPQS